MAFNAIDGMLAREHGQQSALGAFLNELTDVLSDAALYLPFALVAPFSPFWVGTVIVLAGLSEFTGALGPTVGASRRYDGPLGKSDRAFVFGALGLYVALGGRCRHGAHGSCRSRGAGGLDHRQPHPTRAGRGRRRAHAPDDTGIRMTDARVPHEHHFRRTTTSRCSTATGRRPAATRRGAIVLFHRGHEHGARMAHLVDELDLPDFDFFAWDARGHGRRPASAATARASRPRCATCRPSSTTSRSEHGVAAEDIHVIAQSVGAVLVATWAHDYAPRVRGLTLASPAFKVKLYVPFARAGLALMHKLRGLFFVNSYVKAKFLTHDPERIASYESDPLISRPIAVNILLGLYEAADRVVADANAITLPVQLLISGADWVVHHKPQHAFFERLGSSDQEEDASCPASSTTRWASGTARRRCRRCANSSCACSTQPPQPVDLRAAAPGGATADESRALAEPLPALSPRGAVLGLHAREPALGGLLSRGMKLGHETGFDSGSTLDYVYRNEARGAGADRPRHRQDLPRLHRLARHPAAQDPCRRAAARGDGAPGRAASRGAPDGHRRRPWPLRARRGAGAARSRPSSILLRDYSDINVRDGRALIAREGPGGRRAVRAGRRLRPR